MHQEEYDYRTLSGRPPMEIQGLPIKIADKYNAIQVSASLQIDMESIRKIKDRRDLDKYEYSFELERQVLNQFGHGNLRG